MPEISDGITLRTIPGRPGAIIVGETLQFAKHAVTVVAPDGSSTHYPGGESFPISAPGTWRVGVADIGALHYVAFEPACLTTAALAFVDTSADPTRKRRILEHLLQGGKVSSTGSADDLRTGIQWSDYDVTVAELEAWKASKRAAARA
jgi:hypothetical protein